MVNRIKAEMTGTKIVNKLSNLVFLKVFADDGEEKVPVVPESPQGDKKSPEDVQFNFEQLIAKARKEEKEKLYPRLKKMEDDLKAMTESNNSNLLKVAELQQELANLKATDKSADTIKTLQAKIEDLNKELEETKNSVPDEKSIRDKLEEEYQVKMYAQEQLASHKDDILSIFKNEVTGETREEVDKAIQTAIEKTSIAKKELGSVEPTAPKSTPKAPRSVTPAMKSGGGIEIDTDYIRNLDPSSEEYAKLRQKLGLR